MFPFFFLNLVTRLEKRKEPTIQSIENSYHLTFLFYVQVSDCVPEKRLKMYRVKHRLGDN